ncbi:MAG: hypothetical protein HQK81_03530 [Desulfovibrionaceae bacterium]|nr:hypothetical protein [Desulfovibrionaceae bacterium]MBF0513114.1 hypothetical protein [Desulfovibrionaceae bacterium]
MAVYEFCKRLQEPLFFPRVPPPRPSRRAARPNRLNRLNGLREFAERDGFPVAAFDESIAVPDAARRLGFELLKKELWVPSALSPDRAEIIAADPGDPALAERIKAALGVSELRFTAALPEDVVRIVEHNWDVNPGFPACAGRTILARARTYLAIRRSQFATYRTRLAKGRTGLALLRTGLSFCTAALILIRIFGFGYLSIVEAALALAGIFLVADGFVWYIEARGIAKRRIAVPQPARSPGVTVLETVSAGPRPAFRHTEPVAGAEGLRENWRELSPVMRRRVLTLERTDLAEHRTRLAALRSVMAKFRTGLALTRTGIALVGVGIALLRHKGLPVWVYPDSALIGVGLLMIVEGFYWSVPGRHGSKGGLGSIATPESDVTAWDLLLPPHLGSPAAASGPVAPPPVAPGDKPGIFGTTGLALERTVLAERRNLMARFRTALSRSRTGMALIRTGMNFCAVGLGLLVSFGLRNPVWTSLEFCILAIGLVLVADGHYWHLPAEKWKKQFPYRAGDFEIDLPDYSAPFTQWEKVVFDHGRA